MQSLKTRIQKRIHKQIQRQKQQKSTRRKEHYRYARQHGLSSYYGWFMRDWSIAKIEQYIKQHPEEVKIHG